MKSISAKPFRHNGTEPRRSSIDEFAEEKFPDLIKYNRCQEKYQTCQV
jgi:hypothetical protein